MLESERIKLVPFEESFISKQYIGWLNDPVVVQYSRQKNFKHNYESCLDYFKSFMGSPNEFFAIFLKDGNIHIGNISTDRDLENNICDIRIMIGEKNCWGQGLGYEAWSLVCHYLLMDKKIRKITGGCLASNSAMIRLMEKMGMERDGCRIKHQIIDEEPEDIFYYALFNSKDYKK